MRSAPCASRKSRARRRAVGRFAAATESSRSRISASAPLSMPRANFRSLSAGTNSIERMKYLLRSLPLRPWGRRGLGGGGGFQDARPQADLTLPFLLNGPLPLPPEERRGLNYTG